MVPVDWSILWGRVVPAWLDVLRGAQTARQFYGEFVPLGYEHLDLLDLDVAFKAPDAYLNFFRHGIGETLRATDLPADVYADFEKTVDVWDATFLLTLAIKQTAAVDLPGADAFANDPWLAHLSEPRIQVAGTKNLFRFLDLVFEPKYRERERDYRYHRRSGGDPAVQELLEFLFLYVRAIPGSWIHARSLSWPGSDDDSFAGYLTPDEVRALSFVIQGWAGAGDQWDRDLLALFVDRVVRAAQHKLGLITLHAGLG